MFKKMVIRRYPLLALTCLLGLTGCANLQERVGNRSAGTAASMPPPVSTSDSFSPMTSDNFGAPPPPPVPPPPSAITQPPPMSADISSATPASPSSSSSSSSSKAKGDKLYNLEKKKPASVASKPSSKNSTLARLADKATPAKLDLDNAADPAPKAKATTAVSEVAPAKAEVETEAPATASKSKPAEDALPSPAAPADVDTSFLATPVRKGEGGAREKSPQSNLAPEKKTVPRETKPAIVPVSNPADDVADFDTRSYS